MTWLDWTMVATVALSVVLAAAQGFFFEIFSLAGAVLGFLLAMWEYPRVAAWFLPYVKAQQYANLAGFLAIFFSIVILAGMIGRIARWAVHEIGLRGVDRFLGGVFGLLRGTVIVSVAVMAIAAFAPNSPSLARSSLSGYFLLAARTASWAAPSELRWKVREGALAIRNMNPELSPQSQQKPAPGGPKLKSQREENRLASRATELRADLENNKMLNGAASPHANVREARKPSPFVN